jgi:hypothetical protein
VFDLLVSATVWVLTRIQKVQRFFTNHGKPGTTITKKSSQLPKKPRAKSGLDIYGEEHRQDIQEKMKQKIDGHDRLTKWRQSRLEMYMSADEETKAHCEAKAVAFNQELAAPPDIKEIYGCVILRSHNWSSSTFFLVNRNQRDLVSKVSDVLLQLSGWDWGQCGPLAFFVQIAYRDEVDNLQTAKYELL